MTQHETYTLLATAPEELVPILIEEIKTLGGVITKPVYKGVLFTVDKAGFFRMHLRLATASGLLWVIKECSAKSEPMLFSQTRRIKWHKYFSATTPYAIEATVADRGPEFLTGGVVKQALKNAVDDDFKHHLKVEPKCIRAIAEIWINVHVLKQRATVSIKTSGKSLHKRAYRGEGHPAPLKETLAAALLRFVGYDGSQPLLDPFAGSGTFGIEAAYIALDKAANIHRKKEGFAFEHLSTFSGDEWRKAQDAERLTRKSQPAAPIWLSDISPEYIKLARECALRARVEKDLQFRTSDFFKLEAPQGPGLLISNLPYGERLGDPQELAGFYKRVGERLKTHYKGWKVALLVDANTPWKELGIKTSARLRCQNGAIETILLVFNVY